MHTFLSFLKRIICCINQNVNCAIVHEQTPSHKPLEKEYNKTGTAGKTVGSLSVGVSANEKEMLRAKICYRCFV